MTTNNTPNTKTAQDRARDRRRRLTRPYHGTIETLKQEISLLKTMACRDPLTGIKNRAAQEDDFLSIVRTALRIGGDHFVVAIMIDLDHFKNVNDSYGHPGGDEALKHVANILSESIRPTDHLYRHGGEEFLLIAHIKNRKEMALLVERLRKKIESSPCIYNGKEIRLTGSLGAAIGQIKGGDFASDESRDGDEFLKEKSNRLWNRIVKGADEAAYRAKNDGRNKVRFALKVPILSIGSQENFAPFRRGSLTGATTRVSTLSPIPQ